MLLAVVAELVMEDFINSFMYVNYYSSLLWNLLQESREWIGDRNERTTILPNFQVLAEAKM